MNISIAQTTAKYWVFFKDKPNAQRSMLNPDEFLSAKSIIRKHRLGIPIDIRDVPVHSSYLNAIRNTGAEILVKSKWLNAAFIVADPSQKEAVSALSFVSKLQKARDFKCNLEGFMAGTNDQLIVFDSTYFGASYGQIAIHHGDSLHDWGFRGEGMVIAVLDAGFSGIDTLKVFDSLRSENRLLGKWDFVDGDDNVFHGSTHGTYVMSTMAAIWPDTLVGTAPKASYYLFRTENGATESHAEEYNWVAAAERADSLGVDVINSSLGYTTFDDSTTNYTYELMNGDSAIITRGADIAASKGILVVNSAGNSGSGPWHYIGAPADGDSVLAVGAIRRDSSFATFSSWGPSYDGRVKPNVCAVGQGAIGARFDTATSSISGTSFSSPITTGLVTCLWQAFPDLSNMDIFRAVEECAHLYSNPNDSMGYGIPDYVCAFKNLERKVAGTGPLIKQNDISIYPNPFEDALNIQLNQITDRITEVVVCDLIGNAVFRQKVNGVHEIYLRSKVLQQLQPGTYFISIKVAQGYIYTLKAVKE